MLEDAARLITRYLRSRGLLEEGDEGDDPHVRPRHDRRKLRSTRFERGAARPSQEATPQPSRRPAQPMGRHADCVDSAGLRGSVAGVRKHAQLKRNRAHRSCVRHARGGTMRWTSVMVVAFFATAASACAGEVDANEPVDAIESESSQGGSAPSQPFLSKEPEIFRVSWASQSEVKLPWVAPLPNEINAPDYLRSKTGELCTQAIEQTFGIQEPLMFDSPILVGWSLPERPGSDIAVAFTRCFFETTKSCNEIRAIANEHTPDEPPQCMRAPRKHFKVTNITDKMAQYSARTPEKRYGGELKPGESAYAPLDLIGLGVRLGTTKDTGPHKHSCFTFKHNDLMLAYAKRHNDLYLDHNSGCGPRDACLEVWTWDFESNPNKVRRLRVEHDGDDDHRNCIYDTP